LITKTSYKKKMPKISVIIPTWNRADKIKKAIKSALNQTVQDLEVLICDDHSTDNTFQVVSSFNDSRVIWIPGERGGRPAIPRNRGIKVKQGEWIAFLDSDDEWISEKIEKQLKKIEITNCKAVCSNAFRFLPSKGIHGKLIKYRKQWITFDDLLDSNFVICSSLLIHNSILDSVGNFPENPELIAVEDYTLWLRVATQIDFAYIDEALLIYHDDVQSSIRSKDSRSIWLQKKYVLRDFLHWAKKKGVRRDFVAKARKAYIYAQWKLWKKELFGIKKIFRNIF
jgi:glycosyltransferase involved in cell wall biosynthesis